MVLIVVAALLAPDSEETAQSDGTSEPSPTAAATSEATPEETAEGTPTTEPTPSPEPTPAFATIELSGTGDAVPQFEIPEDAAAIATATHTGSANFVVTTISEAGDQNDLLVNTIGNYTGTVLFDEQDGQHSVAFEVTADGAWTISIQPVTEARAWDGRAELTGTGDDVVQIDPAVSGLATANVSHDGAANFVVIAYGGGLGQELLVNEIGAYEGEVLIGDGAFLLEVTADGNWTVTPS